MSELGKRFVVSIVAAPLALWIVLAGGAPLAALLAMVSAVGAWEFFRIARAAGARPLDDVGIALAGLVPLAIHAHYLGVVTMRPAIGALVVLLVMASTIWLRGVDGAPLGAAALTLFGVVYTAGMLGFGYAIRYHDIVAGYDTVGAKHLLLGPFSVPIPPGGALLIFPLLITWASDIGAYVVGLTG